MERVKVAKYVTNVFCVLAITMNTFSYWLIALSLIPNFAFAQDSETPEMANRLNSLVENGHPDDYYHWNKKRAEQLGPMIRNAPPEQRLNTWFRFCQQSLFAGNSQACINEIEAYIKQQNQPIEAQLNERTAPLFELLALAYLRLGEQQNCQQNHSPASCIIPLQSEGIHTLKTGSQKAIELYSLLYDRFQSPTHQWLLNLAYITLGEYPENVPEKYLISIPGYQNEKDHFPAFKEIGMHVGVAVNGLSGGTCVEDFNNDGLLDIFATSYGMEDNVRLMLREKDGFKDATERAGLQGITGGLNCVHADYDNDGNCDILVLRGAWLGEHGNHPNSLLKNMGDGTFRDVTRSSGLLSLHPTQTASWADVNNDGFLDVFIGNENHPCELFLNNGDGTFTEHASEFGLGNITEFVKGVVWGDINNDGWMDLYISILGGKNRLYKNDGGSFSEIADMAGVGDPYYSFPCWFWDVNNDGFQDIFVSGYDLRNLNNLAGDYALELQGENVQSAKPRLYLNKGDETFEEASIAFDISKTMYTMGGNFGDLDNDGFLDFYVGTGAPDFATVVPNRMFRNVNGEKFEEVTAAGNFGHIQKGHGVAFADLDNDGDQDIYAVMGGAYEGDTFRNILYENPMSINNWIVIELEGTSSNRSAIGCRLALTLDDGREIHRTVSSGGSFGASSLQQEIGLGQAKRIKTLVIHWPGGKTESFEKIKPNQKVMIREGEGKLRKVEYVKRAFKAMHHHKH